MSGKRSYLFLLVLLFTANVYASEVTANSRISEVVIYPDSALITRSADLKLATGEHKIIFPGIIPEIDENSIRVAGSGDSESKLLGAEVKREYLEDAPSEKIKDLQLQIQELEDGIRRTQDVKNLLLEEKNFLDSIRLFSHEQLPKDLVSKVPSASELENTLKFLDGKLRDNYSGVMDTEVKVRELMKKVGVLRNELSQISGPQKKLKRSIVVEAQCLKQGILNLSVSYLVKGASWQPIYDARASFEKNQVELVSHGIVRQNTGEDWQGVEISLSTAKPAVGGRMPYVSPWFLRPYQTQAWKSKAETRILGIGKRAQSQYEAFDDLENIAVPRAPQEQNYASAQERGIAVVYKLPHLATIKSDGSEHKLPVSSQVLQAKFVYSTYPRVNTSAYLGSRATNSKDLQLLAGRVNIFLEGDFVGTSSIDNIAPGEEFDLYLGVDENVKIKRDLIEKKADDLLMAGIPSPNKKTSLKYKVSVENYKNKKISVIVFEAMPVSEDERIKAKINNVSLEPKEKDWQNRKGVWRWELELEPKAKKEIFYNFMIEHPRDMQVEGL